MHAHIRRLLLALVLVAPGGCADASSDAGRPRAVTVFAAASTIDAMSEVAGLFTAATGVPVRCSFGASSTLARQIEHGASADLFLSANPAWMDHLGQRGRLAPSTRADLLGNRLVLIAPSESEADGLADALAGARRIALGDPDHVPAGIYARRALSEMGLWDDNASRIVAAVDVRAALHMVALGAADAGVVYATDAAGSEAVRIVAPIPAASGDRIVYPVALLAGDAEPIPSAVDLMAFLRSDEARRVFLDHGFTPLPPS